MKKEEQRKGIKKDRKVKRKELKERRWERRENDKKKRIFGRSRKEGKEKEAMQGRRVCFFDSLGFMAYKPLKVI